MVKALCQRIRQGDAEASEALLRIFEPTLRRMATAFAKCYGNTAQFVGSVGDAFSAICCLQIFRFTSSKPSKSAIASDEKFIRLRTNSFVRYCPMYICHWKSTIMRRRAV